MEYRMRRLSNLNSAEVGNDSAIGGSDPRAGVKSGMTIPLAHLAKSSF
jgi:hypothetical protein